MKKAKLSVMSVWPTASSGAWAKSSLIVGWLASGRVASSVSGLPNSRAILRHDQPLADKAKIECCKFTSSSFTLISSLRCPRRDASLKVAGFHSTLRGWF
jgi:hypothetical protein